LVEAAVKGESLGPLRAENPFLTDCLLDHFARWEDVPDTRKTHERALGARRHIAFLLGTHRLHCMKQSRCALMGEE